MTPFYQDELATIYHADFRDYTGVLPAAAVITDPPYEETDLAWDRWPDGWPAWLRAHLPATASLWCFGSLRLFTDRAAEFAGWRLAQDIVWEKPNGSSLHTDRFRRVHELAAQFYPKTTKWADVFKSPIERSVTEERVRGPIHRQGKPLHWGDLNRGNVTYEYDGTRLARSVMFAPAVREGVEHGTPKPVPILRDLVTYSVPPGGAAADIFCGSGSLLVACKELGRRAIGFDADLAACRESARRCRATPANFSFSP